MAKGLSLHIGVNEFDPAHYGSNGKLNACEADARSMQAIADALGYKSTRFLTREATRDAVTSYFDFAATQLTAGDILFISYSGHGGQLPDRDGDEFDLEDETWCLYDGQLVDDELYVLFGRLQPGVRCVVLSDSCHSGSLLKHVYYEKGVATGLIPAASCLTFASDCRTAKFLPRDFAQRTYEKNRAFYESLIGKTPKKSEGATIDATIRLISGCQDNQYSFDGTFNSVFTAHLIAVWRNGAFDGDYGRFHKEIQRRCEPSQSPNHMTIGPYMPEFDRQKPFTI